MVNFISNYRLNFRVLYMKSYFQINVVCLFRGILQKKKNKFKYRLHFLNSRKINHTIKINVGIISIKNYTKPTNYVTEKSNN